MHKFASELPVPDRTAASGSSENSEDHWQVPAAVDPALMSGAASECDPGLPAEQAAIPTRNNTCSDGRASGAWRRECPARAGPVSKRPVANLPRFHRKAAPAMLLELHDPRRGSQPQSAWDFSPQSAVEPAPESNSHPQAASCRAVAPAAMQSLRHDSAPPEP